MLKLLPPLALFWASGTPAATGQTGGAGMPILVGAGAMPGAAYKAGGRGWCHVGAGWTGSSCWKIRGGGLVGKGGCGIGRSGRPRGEAASLPSPPLRPRMMLCGAFLPSLRGFFFPLPREIGKRWSYSNLLKAAHKSFSRLQTSNAASLSGAGHYPTGWGVRGHF